MIHALYKCCTLVALFLTLVSCRGGGEARSVSSEELQLNYAQRITDEHLTIFGREYQHIAVDASVYKGLMEMLGVEAKCLDFSADMKPDVEKIAASKADLLLLSAYEGVDIAKYERLGIPIVKCTDFIESSPLARAEWMRYFGRLWGVEEKADSLFAVVEADYNVLCDASHNRGEGQQVIFDTLYGNQWYQPAENSTIGQLVAMAGGKVIGGKDQQGGSVALSAEQVLLQGGEADYWFIRVSGKDELTLGDLAKMNPVYSQLKAFKDGNVFVCYTDKTHFFEETPFRPDWLLDDIKGIVSPPAPKGGVLRYFNKIK